MRSAKAEPPPQNPSPSRRYRVYGVLGKGGFGTVYRAEFLGLGGFTKPVALKVLNPEIASMEQVAERLRDEARLLALLNHRAIVQADGLVMLAGQWTVVMERVDGVDLKRVLQDQGPLPLGIAIEVAQEVASALHAAYDRPAADGKPLKVLHRDIKPSNIHITPAGVVKVLDFGVARGEFGSREARTQNLIFGSQGYMAPERTNGFDSHASDTYSLAVVLYEMLTGATMGPSPIYANAHTAHVAEVVSHVTKRHSDPQLKALLEDALTWDPYQRPAAREVERSLRRLRAAHSQPWIEDWADAIIPRLQHQAIEKEGPLSGQVLNEQDPATLNTRTPNAMRQARFNWRAPSHAAPSAFSPLAADPNAETRILRPTPLPPKPAPSSTPSPAAQPPDPLSTPGRPDLGVLGANPPASGGRPTPTPNAITRLDGPEDPPAPAPDDHPVPAKMGVVETTPPPGYRAAPPHQQGPAHDAEPTDPPDEPITDIPTDEPWEDAETERDAPIFEEHEDPPPPLPDLSALLPRERNRQHGSPAPTTPADSYAPAEPASPTTSPPPDDEPPPTTWERIAGTQLPWDPVPPQSSVEAAPVAAVPATPPDRSRRHWLILVPGVLLVLAALTGIVFVLFRYKSSPPVTPPASTDVDITKPAPDLAHDDKEPASVPPVPEEPTPAEETEPEAAPSPAVATPSEAEPPPPRRTTTRQAQIRLAGEAETGTLTGNGKKYPLSSQAIKVPAGTYKYTTTLKNGQPVSGDVQVVTGKEVIIECKKPFYICVAKTQTIR